MSVIDLGVLTLGPRVEAEGLERLGPDGVLTEPTSKIMNRAFVKLVDRNPVQA